MKTIDLLKRQQRFRNKVSSRRTGKVVEKQIRSFRIPNKQEQYRRIR